MGMNRAIVARLDEERVTTALERTRMRIVNRICWPRLATIPLRPPLSSNLTVTLEEIASLSNLSRSSHFSCGQFLCNPTRQRRIHQRPNLWWGINASQPFLGHQLPQLGFLCQSLAER